MSLRSEFLAEVELFLQTVGMDPTVFGRDAMRDPSFVRELRAGRVPGAVTIDKVRDFIRSYRAPVTTGPESREVA